MKKFSHFSWVAFFVLQNTVAAQPRVNILSYSSFQGTGSLGEWISKQPKSPCAHVDCHFLTPHPSRSLFEELRFRKNQSTNKIDLVIGIDTVQLHWAEDAGVVKGSTELLGESPLVVLLHKDSRLSLDKNPLSWSEVPVKLKGRVVVQDPRYSAIAQTFLIWGVQRKLFTVADFKKMTARVFPKWSASFEYFSKSADLGLLTFATSQSYGDCHPKDPPTRILQVQGESPRYQEWIASTEKVADSSPVRELLDFMKTEAFTRAVPEFNWLISSEGLKGTPPCFQKSTFPSSSPPALISAAEYQKWMDEWAL